MAQHDFTTGNIFKQLIVFSTPILLANLLQTSYQFIDSLWVGNLIGSNALGAVAVSSTVIFTILSFIIGINNAALTILSQAKGRNNEERLKRYLNGFVVILFSLALLLGISGYVLAEFILNMMGTPQDIIPQAVKYLQINLAGIVFLFGYNFIGTILRAMGNSKAPLRFVFIAVILNTILDPIFISVFDLGIEGAAFATILSQGFSFFYGLWYIIKQKIVPLSLPKIPKREETLTILKLGIPSGLQMSVISAGLMAIMSVVNSYGNSVVAGFGAAQRLDSILMLPAHALGTAVNSMAGQNIGREKWERVHKISLYAVFYNLMIMFVIALLVFLFASWGISLFVEDEKAVHFGTQYLKIIAFFYPFLGINFILNGVVRASGAMMAVLMLNIISFWVLRFPLTSLASSLFGSSGIGIGMGASFFISSFFAILYYRYGTWKEKKIFSK
ncbi:MATE family efflux transporter [Peribacillus deserti]|uniref:MATE family efflux transporter n=1 Tax=Peribacillus deserti TaxID=673318 RepID=A0A2N5M4T4_9BACI|nr:MATE family efflux transporter [Peribacillus deserti]PLT29367.1 MATE family efflux transporter [Peribacillus deserti]